MISCIPAMSAPKIQFEDSILPVGQAHRVPSAAKRSSVYEKHSSELDDEEKAREIADHDLNGSRKQVRVVVFTRESQLILSLAEIRRSRPPLAQLPIHGRHLR